MTNQTFEEKLESILDNYAKWYINKTLDQVRSGGLEKEITRVNPNDISTKQAILSLIEEDVIGKDEPTFGAQNEAGDISLEDYETSAMNYLRYNQRKLIKGEK